MRQVTINRSTWLRLIRGFKQFAASEVGGTAKGMAVLLITLLLAINGLNVLNSYVGRDFMTAIERQQMGDFVWQAILYIGVFVVCTIVAVYYRYIEEALGLLWRGWLTRRLVNVYLEHTTYYRLNDRFLLNGEIANPDQRIAEDVRAFTGTTLSFILMFLNSTFTVVLFSGVLWSISPLLLGVAVTYAVCGSLMTILLGRRLVALNYDQFDKEADFRADLIHVRENAESVALLHREGRLRARLLRHLDALVGNFQRIIGVNRNLGFFTTGYNYLIQIIPALIVAPQFISGRAEFGVITQSAMAFAHLLGAFSLIVTQFQSISSFTAVIARLSSLVAAIEQAYSNPVSDIKLVEDDERIVYEQLTLKSPVDGHPLVRNLSVSIPHGRRVLVVGPDDTVKVALFRATAGIWGNGGGRILCPSVNRMLFLPERPYLPPGTLRELLLHTGQEHAIRDGRIMATLNALGLEPVLTRAGGLDVEQDWDGLLSLGEQQLLAVARLLLAEPHFALLDRISAALTPEQVVVVLNLLTENSISYIKFGKADVPFDYFDAILELSGEGDWKWKLLQEEPIVKVVGG